MELRYLSSFVGRCHALMLLLELGETKLRDSINLFVPGLERRQALGRTVPAGGGPEITYGTEVRSTTVCTVELGYIGLPYIGIPP